MEVLHINGWRWPPRNICVVGMERPWAESADARGMKPRVPTPPPRNALAGPQDSGPFSTVIHELGHYMHMVTDGSGNTPDNLGNYKKTTGGPHCSKHLPGVGSTLKKPCVMLFEGRYRRADSFCDKCLLELRKMDLSEGNKSFIDTMPD